MPGEQPSEQTQRIAWGQGHLPSWYDFEQATQSLDSSLGSLARAKAVFSGTVGPHPERPKIEPLYQHSASEFGGWFKKPTSKTYGTPRSAITTEAETTEAGMPAQTEAAILQGHSNADGPAGNVERPKTIRGVVYMEGRLKLGQVPAGGQESPAAPAQPYEPRHYGTAKVEHRRPTRHGRRIALAVGTMAAVTALAFGAHTPAIASEAPNVVDKIEKTYVDIISAW